MKKINALSAIVALWGASLPVAAVESFTLQDKTRAVTSVAIHDCWTFDHATKKITNTSTLTHGELFQDDDVLSQIFNDLSQLLTESHYDGYTIELSHYFLKDYKGTSIDLSPIAQRIAHIGHGFLWNAESLTSFDTSGLTNLITISNCFLRGAESLTSFDTQGLINVTTIGHCFLSGTASLTSFDARGLINVTKIGAGFLGKAEALTSLNAQGLNKNTKIRTFHQKKLNDADASRLSHKDCFEDITVEDWINNMKKRYPNIQFINLP